MCFCLQFQVWKVRSQDMTVGLFRAALRLVQIPSPHLIFAIALGGLSFTSSKGSSSLCWEQSFCYGTVSRSALEELPRNAFHLFISACVHPQIRMRLGLVIWASCVLQSGGGGYGGEMTLDPDHMSQCFGRSTTFPLAPCFFSGLGESHFILASWLICLFSQIILEPIKNKSWYYK